MSESFEQSYPVNMVAGYAICLTLYHLGYRAFFISPGYRDAPLVAALKALADEFDDLVLVSAVDERAGAFQALGYCKKNKNSGGPGAVLICTSGTAGANYYPALIEASKDQVPIFVMTADRPIDLRYTNSNQVIDQTGFFGQFVNTSIDLPAAYEPFLTLKLAKTYIKRIQAHVHKAARSSLQWPQGPVHLNVPFPEPLEPNEGAYLEVSSLVQSVLKTGHLVVEDDAPSALSILSEKTKVWLRDLISVSKRPFLIIGSLERNVDVLAVSDFLRRSRIPRYIDVTAQLKTIHTSSLGPHHKEMQAWWKNGYQPDLVLHLGGALVGKHFEILQKNIEDHVHVIKVSREKDIVDSLYLGANHLQTNVADFLSDMSTDLEIFSSPACFEASPPAAPSYADDKLSVSSQINMASIWPGVARTVLETLPPSFDLFLGNSSAIRIFDEKAGNLSVPRRIYSNRGVSGIEGLLATTLGVSLAEPEKPICLVLGDISMMHDLNSLLSLSVQKLPVLVLILNDHRGGVFDLLPIAQHKTVCDPFISTPHSFSFAGICEMAHLSYVKVKKSQELEMVLKKVRMESLPLVVELSEKMRTNN